MQQHVAVFDWLPKVAQELKGGSKPDLLLLKVGHLVVQVRHDGIPKDDLVEVPHYLHRGGKNALTVRNVDAKESAVRDEVLRKGLVSRS
jgi:hypothetical protein